MFESCKKKIEEHLGYDLNRRQPRHKTILENQERKTTVVLITSREHDHNNPNAGDAGYLLSFSSHHKKSLSKFENGYVGLGCGSEDLILLFTKEEFFEVLDDFPTVNNESLNYFLRVEKRIGVPSANLFPIPIEAYKIIPKEFHHKLFFLKHGKSNEHTIKSYSWEVSGNIAIKHLDKSAFHHHGTGIPFEIRPFFGLEEFLEGENRPTTLLYKGNSFSAHCYIDPTQRIRLHWRTDFDNVLKNELPGWFERFAESEEIIDEPPVIKFEKLSSEEDTYSIDFISIEDSIQLIDDTVEQEIINNTDIDETERKAIVSSRRGQGRFRQNLAFIEKGCRVTGVTDPRLLRASHIKPWRSCADNHERLDGYNGFLLAPHIDLLFDRGYISFSDNGDLMISPRIESEQLALLNISSNPTLNVGVFSDKQKEYLKFHRTEVFLDER